MRGLTLMLLCLGLGGCSRDNPGFAITADTSTANTGLTDEPVTTTVAPTSDASGTTAVTSTQGPGDTSGAASTGPVGPPACELPPINDAFAPYLLMNGEPLPTCPATDFYVKGKLAVGDPLLLASDPVCGAPNDAVYTLGTGLALPAQAISGCLKTYLKLIDTAEGCKIDQIKTYDPNVVPSPNYLIAAFSAAPDGLPFTPLAVNSSYCGCPDPNNDGVDCCAELDPGALTLQPSNDANVMIEQFSHKAVTAGDGQLYEFYNLQSWVGPECADDPAAGLHVDWIAVATP